MRNDKVGGVARDLALKFRIRHSAFRILVLLAACTPVTTRPAFTPYPEALRVVLNVPPARVVTEAQTLLGADSTAPAVQLMSPIDGYLETRWHEGVKLRVWADPDVPGKSRVTVETVYVPIEDPSRTARDVERACPEGSAGRRLAERLVAGLSEKLGVTKY